MGTAARPAAGGSPAGRARRAPGAESSVGVDGSNAPPAGASEGLWAVPGVTDAPDLTDPGELPKPGGRQQRRKRGERASPEERAERAERSRQIRQAELEADPEAVARQICLRLLTAAPRTRAQLADALRKRGVPEQAAETVLERFADVQLIDDAMFAQAWVDTRHHGRGLARRALAAELRQRGVAAEEIRTAVDRVGPDQELATAQAMVERRLASTRRLPKQTRFRRLMGMLARKGYSEGLAYRVVRAALDSEESDAVRYLDRMAGRDATPAVLLDADRFADRFDEPDLESDEPEPEPDDNSDSW